MKKLKFFLFAAFASLCFSGFAMDGFIRNATFYMKSNIIDFSESGIRENVVKGKSVYVKPTQLKVGDIFIDVDGGAKKVVKIIKDGKSISIKTVKPDFREVYDFIDIPDQSADFSPAISEYIDKRYSPETSDYSKAAGGATEKTLLDEMLPKSAPNVKYIETTIRINSKIDKWSTFDPSSGVTQQAIDAMSQEERAAFDEQVNEYKNKKKVITNGEVRITPKIRMRTGYDKANTSFRFASVDIDRKGTWRIWKWKIIYKPGYLNFDYVHDTELGIGIQIAGGVYSSFQVPLYATPSPTGLYLKFLLEFKPNFTANYEFQYYTRDVKIADASSDVNAVLVPSNIRTKCYEWTPSATQHDIYANGDMKAGPSLSVGLKVAKIALVEVYGFAGVGISGYVGGKKTDKNLDEDHYRELIACEKLPDEVRNSLSTAYTTLSALNDGWSFMGNASGKLFATVDFRLFDNHWFTNLINFETVFWTIKGFQWTPGWTSPFRGL